MSSQKAPYTSFNQWFLIPFSLWAVLGGVSLLLFDAKTLFSSVNTHHTILLDNVMPYITMMGEGVFGVLILLLLLSQDSFRNWWYFFAALLCNGLPAILVQIIKGYYNEPRPMAVFNKAAWIHILPNWEVLMENSFPSGHTSAAFCLYAFLSMILVPRFKRFGLLFFLLALSVAYSRLYLAAHFFLDVYVSSMIGVSFTILIVWLMRNKERFIKAKS